MTIVTCCSKIQVRTSFWWEEWKKDLQKHATFHGRSFNDELVDASNAWREMNHLWTVSETSSRSVAFQLPNEGAPDIESQDIEQEKLDKNETQQARQVIH